jgi:hypothetical protein
MEKCVRVAGDEINFALLDSPIPFNDVKAESL